MAYLNAGDYVMQIQDVNLQQIINSNVAVRGFVSTSRSAFVLNSKI